LLTGLGAGTATLEASGARHMVTLETLASMWRGEFATLWRVPAGYAGPLADGARGPVVDRLAALLAAARHEAAPAAGQPLDAALRGRLFAFQLTQGLQPDGVAGPTTFMQLNRAGGVTEPRLAAGG
jgi:general secretion pathway protein A